MPDQKFSILTLFGAVLICCCLLFQVRNTCFWLFWNFLLILLLSHSFCLFRKDSLASFRSSLNWDNLDSNVRSLVLRNHFLSRFSIFFWYFVNTDDVLRQLTIKVIYEILRLIVLILLFRKTFHRGGVFSFLAVISFKTLL